MLSLESVNFDSCTYIYSPQYRSGPTATPQ